MSKTTKISKTSKPTSNTLKITKTSPAKKEETWTEKYRPTTLDEVIGNSDVIKQFKKMRDNGNVNHMILAGPPGTGKTTSVSCLARELLDDSFDDAYIELNASDERGIEVIRNKIKDFCQKSVDLPPNKHKIIFLDEAESLTIQAQQALRRIIESFAKTTRFAMACNSSTKLIDAIQSRCNIIRFGKVSTEEMLPRIEQICKLENVKHDKAGLEALIDAANGDMRTLLNNLEMIHCTFGKISLKNVNRRVNKPSISSIQSVLQFIIKDNNFDKADLALSNLINTGYSALDIVECIFEALKDYTELETPIKIHCLSIIGDTQFRVSQGADAYIQLVALLSKIYLLIVPSPSSSSSSPSPSPSLSSPSLSSPKFATSD